MLRPLSFIHGEFQVFRIYNRCSWQGQEIFLFKVSNPKLKFQEFNSELQFIYNPLFAHRAADSVMRYNVITVKISEIIDDSRWAGRWGKAETPAVRLSHAKCRNKVVVSAVATSGWILNESRDKSTKLSRPLQQYILDNLILPDSIAGPGGCAAVRGWQNRWPS